MWHNSLPEKSSLGRNEPCHCGSGQKYKRCCLRKDEEAELLRMEAAPLRAQPPVWLSTNPTILPPPDYDIVEYMRENHQLVRDMRRLAKATILEHERRELEYAQARADVAAMEDEQIWSELKARGAHDPQADLGPLIQATPFSNGGDLAPHLKGLKFDHADDPDRWRLAEFYTASLIDMLWERHYTHVPSYFAISAGLMTYYDYLESGAFEGAESPTEQDAVKAVEQVWQVIERGLPDPATTAFLEGMATRGNFHMEHEIMVLCELLARFGPISHSLTRTLERVADKLEVLPEVEHLRFELEQLSKL